MRKRSRPVRRVEIEVFREFEAQFGGRKGLLTLLQYAPPEARRIVALVAEGGKASLARICVPNGINLNTLLGVCDEAALKRGIELVPAGLLIAPA